MAYREFKMNYGDYIRYFHEYDTLHDHDLSDNSITVLLPVYRTKRDLEKKFRNIYEIQAIAANGETKIRYAHNKMTANKIVKEYDNATIRLIPPCDHKLINLDLVE